MRELGFRDFHFACVNIPLDVSKVTNNGMKALVALGIMPLLVVSILDIALFLDHQKLSINYDWCEYFMKLFVDLFESDHHSTDILLLFIIYNPMI